ncbi:MAG TPA: hypothetical protein VFE65_37520 [Pseudonocardia sp.]|nr:hypothetical protein [Pseudonocardia sp.]
MCAATSAVLQPYELHRPAALHAAVWSFIACGSLLCAAVALEHSGWRYYTEHGTLYQINDNAVAVQRCGGGAFLGFLAFVILMLLSGIPKNVPYVQETLMPPARIELSPKLPPEPPRSQAWYSDRR